LIELPAKLLNGQAIGCKSSTAKICRTGKRDKQGRLIYRLRHGSGIKGNGLFTRDDLQAMGCVTVEEVAA